MGAKLDLQATRPAAAVGGQEQEIAKLKRERGPFKSDDDLLLAAFYIDSEYKALKAAGPIKTDYPLASTPLLTLVKEIALRPDIKSFHFIQRKAG